MITRNFNLAFALAIAWTSVSTAGFELITHGAITNRAYAASALGAQPGALKTLGLVDLAAPFGENYYDFTSFTISKRVANAYERSKMLVAQTDQLRVRGWLMRGAIREDDGGVLAAARAGEPYLIDPDPSGLVNRFCNHFLDPITRNPLSSTFAESPLTFVGCPNGANISAPNWAMGTVAGGGDAFSSTPEAVDNFRNHFTIFVARETMWRALTMKQRSGAPAPRVVGDTDEQMRKAYWATTFRALGDVLHLNQDMAQPQHTRNEAHGVGHASVFEHYVDARAARTSEFVFDSEGKVTLASGQLPELPLNVTYPIPRFDRYSDYWSSASGNASISFGRGLADYASRGFFTPGKNLGNFYTGFPSPTNNEAAYDVTTETPQSSRDCTGFGGRVKYANGALPPDYIATSSGSTRYASRGLLAATWTINRCVFEERVDLLIPRAVAYSAGLIDYFFRGQMEIFLPAEGVYAIVDHSLTANNCKDNCGFTQLKLKVANSTPDIVVSGGNGAAIPQAMTGSGTLVAVAKYRKNTCYTADLEGEYDSSKAGESKAAYAQRCRSANEEITVSQPLTGTGNFPPSCAGNCEANALPLIFTFNSPIPINATDLYLQVVYRGPLGAEQDAVVVATKDIPEPTYFSLMNTTDYMVCSGGSYFYRNADGTGYPGAPLYPYQTWMAFQPDNGSSVGTAIARIDDLRPKEYVRVAALVDTGRTYARNIAGLAGPDLQLLSAVNTGLNQTNYAANGTATADVFDFRINNFRKVKSHFAFTRVTGSTDCVPASPPAHAYPPEPAYPPHTPPAMRAVTIRPFS